jgi:glycerophosphoryl diester phosphodiesterase
MSTLTKRIGHKGADTIAPGNTYESFDAALAAGVDMIEFDVLPEHPDGSGRLLIAHDYGAARRRTPPTLDEALDHLCSDAFAGIGFDVDLKLPGYELGVVEALRSHDAIERSIISTQYVESLAAIRPAEPALKLGWTVPKLRRDPFRSPLTAPLGLAGLVAARAVLPTLAVRALRAGRCDALMAQWRLVTPRLVRAVLGAGGEIYVWTVDEAARIRALQALGVTGVITNDPRLFS